MNAKNKPSAGLLLCLLFVLVLLPSTQGNGLLDVSGQSIPTENGVVEVVNPYYSIQYFTLADGTPITKGIINAPPTPPEGFSADHLVVTTSLSRSAVLLVDFPSYNWVFWLFCCFWRDDYRLLRPQRISKYVCWSDQWWDNADQRYLLANLE
jgi:hypothetical protein